MLTPSSFSSSLTASTNGSSALTANLQTYTAWRFDRVLPGSFRRNKADFAHLVYPIVGPLPSDARNTKVREQSRHGGPYIYFVADDKNRVRYVGKSKELSVLHRWIRPGVGGPAKHYWTHSHAGGGCVFNMAQGLQAGSSAHFTLRYVPLSEVSAAFWQVLGFASQPTLEQAEKAFIRHMAPDWNRA